MTVWVITITAVLLLASVSCAQEPNKGLSKDKNKIYGEKKCRSLFDGKTLGKWKIVTKYDFKNHGPIEIQDCTIAIAAGSPGSGICWKGKTPKNDYEISLEAERTAGSDFFCGLTFPIEESYCTLIVGGWGGTIIGLSNIDDSPAVENMSCTSREFKNNRWYNIRLRVTAQNIEVWIDKEKVIDQPTKNHKFKIWWQMEPFRPLGIATWKTSSALKNIRIKKLGKAGTDNAGAKNAKR
jgi:hypothetical protein